MIGVFLIAYAIAQVFGCCYLVSVFMRWMQGDSGKRRNFHPVSAFMRWLELDDDKKREPIRAVSDADIDRLRKELDDLKADVYQFHTDKPEPTTQNESDPQLDEIIEKNNREYERIEEERRRKYERGIDFKRSIERCKRWIPDADVKIRSALHQYAAFGQTSTFYWISESDYKKITTEMWEHMTGYIPGSPFDRPDGKVGEYHCTPVYCVREGDVAWLKRQSVMALP